MTLYALCVIFLIGAVSYVCIDRLLRTNLRISMESDARQQALKLTSSLDSVQQSLLNLSKNTLLINAILDTSGSRAYIDSFMKSYRPAGYDSIRLTLCDFKGDPIATNLPSPGLHKPAELVRQTVERGVPYAAVLEGKGKDNDALFLLAYPVVWGMTNRAEGVLVAELPVGKLIDARLFAVGNNGTGARVLSGERELFSRNITNGSGLMLFKLPLPAAAPMNTLGLALQVEDHRRISLWWLVPVYGVAGAILLLLSTVLARRVSLSVTSKLRALGEVAQRVAESGSLDLHADLDGPDDVKALAASFNAMIDRVRASRENLERRVEERTAELSVANEALVRLNYEKDLAIDGLQDALEKISTLRGLLPICASCKKIRDDKGYWNQIEVYISEHTQADFSHGICPDCAKELYGEFMK
jgi:HAMP domain-containing protein